MNRSQAIVHPEGPWSYERRIPVIFTSGVISVVLCGLGLLFPGLGIFLANDVAPAVSFWSNAVVWCGFGLMIGCQVIAIWMYFGKWLWTAPQLGVLSLFSLISCLYGFVFAPLMSAVIYGDASIFAKSILLFVVLSVHLFWGVKILKSCWAVIDDADSYGRAFVLYPGVASVFFTDVAMSLAEKKGFSSTPSALFIVTPFVFALSMFIFGGELVFFFRMPFVPLMLLIMGLGIFLLFTSLLVFSIVMHFLVPARIVNKTELPVLANLMNSGKIV